MSGGKVFTNLIWRFAERIGARLISVVVNLILALLYQHTKDLFIGGFL